MSVTNRKAARYGTVVTLLHLLVNLVHGAAHRELHIDLTSPETLFVVAVILVGLLLSMGVLWTRWQRFGLLLMAGTLAASLAFGLYHHFIVPGPDQVGAQASGPWGTAFALTAYALLVLEAAGTYIGIRFLIRPAG